MSDIDGFELRMHRAFRAGLMRAAEALKEQAIRDMPVGDPAEDPDPAVNLADSTRIEADEGLLGPSVSVIVDAPHAKKQELDRRLSHPRGGKSNYLGGALAIVEPQVERIIADAVRKAL